MFQLEVVKLRKNRTKLSRVRKQFALFSGCSSRIAFYDLDLCLVEILLVVSIVVLVVQEFWQCLALGKQYFMELENWFELLILSLAISTLSLKAELDSLQVVAAVGICLAWIELIFLFGRYPFLGNQLKLIIHHVMRNFQLQVAASASCTTPSLRGFSRLLWVLSSLSVLLLLHFSSSILEMRQNHLTVLEDHS